MEGDTTCFNQLACSITVVDCPRQINVIDDDKEHFEGSTSAYSQTTLKRVKNIKDNRWQHILHKTCVVAAQMPSCLKHEKRGDSTFPSGVSTHSF